MKILVTGAAGFIGFHISRRLLENGYKVNIGLNLNKKTISKDFYENGSFVYIEVPNQIMSNQTRATILPLRRGKFYSQHK